jgi:Ca2+-transporting ATPase
VGFRPGETFGSTPDRAPKEIRVAPAPSQLDPPGLSAADAARLLLQFGPNELAAAAKVPGWRRLLAQFSGTLTLVLLGAAALSFVVSGELKTPIVVVGVVVVNAIVGHLQEHRAERSLDALRSMLVGRSRVRRDGELQVVDSTSLVPGDLVLVEAGDRVPADGRVITASHVEVDEATLSGESLPIAVGTGATLRMNTVVTRGRAEFVVTATGMDTEMGRIAGLLERTATERTPLQRQLDGLGHSLAKLAAGIVAVVVAIDLLRGEPFTSVMLTAVAVAVAAIPEGLPAVTAITLAIGVSSMARRHAIVKRLASVETLGCTTVICTDKTGTLTLNQMTAVEFVAPNGPAAALSAMVLCNDADVRDDADGRHVVGDPTEGALVSLALQHGIDIADMRDRHPRLAELPFDSANKFMATAHRFDLIDHDQGTDHDHDHDHDTVRLMVKGAPDVLLAHDRSPDADALRSEAVRMGEGGRRVIAVAHRDIARDEWEGLAEGDLVDAVRSLTVLALVGLVDPPRPEARSAIAAAHGAGIDVKMITGDHASTATAIGSDLGLHGGTMTGGDLATIDDEELDRRIEATTVFARVAPEHKMRIVAALQRRGHVVAMTGDGVNDAPALKKADIGIAMGITGTDVSKEAATMVLTDDNFATIVDAVGRGRTIYGNIVKFVRFQLSTTLGFALVFLFAALLGIGDGKPFTAIAILWVNIIMDGPPAMALGLDPADADVLSRRPRPSDEPILTGARWGAVALSAATMATGTLAVLQWAPAAIATTMAFNTFVLAQFFNILNSRHDTRSAFHRESFRNRCLWSALSAVLALQVLVTHVGWFQRLFSTRPIGGTDWLVCIAVASVVLWIDELRKWRCRQSLNRSS